MKVAISKGGEKEEEEEKELGGVFLSFKTWFGLLNLGLNLNFKPSLTQEIGL